MSERAKCGWLRFARIVVLWAGCFAMMTPALSLFLFFGSALLVGVIGTILSDTLKSRGVAPIRQAKIMLGSYVLVVLVGVGSVFFIYSPKQMFLRHVASPVPASVDILDSQYYGGIDSIAYIHFTASPEDLERIISEGKYKLVENPDPNSAAQALARFKYFPRPDWFRPNLERDWVHYLRLNEHIDSYDIFYSPSTGEAYYIWLNF